MEKLQKLAFTKKVDSEKKTIEHYASTYGWDRDEERFVKGAWELDNYRKNPVVLWSHNPALPPIGRNVDLREDENGLVAVTEFDAKGEFAMEVFSLFERKFLNAFSVGFMRKDFVMEEIGNGKKGLSITKAELFEYSAVSVPANPGALVSREVAEIAMKTIGADIIEVIPTKSLGDQFLVVPSSVFNSKDGGAVIDLADGREFDQEYEVVLKRLVEMSKVAKGSKITETKRGLITTAISVFNEILSSAEVTSSELEMLEKSLGDFSQVVVSVYPSAKPSIEKTISQIKNAVKGPAA